MSTEQPESRVPLKLVPPLAESDPADIESTLPARPEPAMRPGRRISNHEKYFVTEGRLDRLKRVGAFCGRSALRVGLIGLFSVGAVRSFGTVEGDIGDGAVRVQASMSLDTSGDAVANVGFGEAQFDMFDGIYGVEARSVSVSSDIAKSVREITDKAVRQGRDPAKALTDAYRNETNWLAIKTLLKGGTLGLGGAVIGGLFAELLINETRRKRQKGEFDSLELVRLRNVALGPLALLLAGGVSIATFNRDSLEHPQLNRSDALGALVNIGESAFGTFDDYRQNSNELTTWFDNFNTLKRSIETAAATQDNLIPIIMMSDVHSKPCTYDRVEALVKAYKAEAVFNTGDETEWGEPFELSVFCPGSNPGQLKVPMVFVSGNHDGPNIVEALKKYKNVINLEGNVVKLKLKTRSGEISFLMLGANDPVWTQGDPTIDYDDPKVRAAWIAKEVTMGERLAQVALKEKPEVIMVHEPAAAERIKEILGPNYKGTIISGHTHQYKLEQDGKLAWVTAATAGASGLRGFENEGSSNVNSWSVSYFNKDTKELEKIIRVYIDNYGNFCTDEIYLKQKYAPPANLQQLRCDIALPAKKAS